MKNKKQTGGPRLSPNLTAKDLLLPGDADELDENAIFTPTSLLEQEPPVRNNPYELKNIMTPHSGFISHDVDYHEYAPYITHPDGTPRTFSILDDIDELRAHGQTGWEKFKHGVPKFFTRTGTNVVGSTVGLVYGAGEFITGLVGGEGWQGATNSFFDNDFQRSLDGINEWMDGALPHYYTKEEQDYNFFQALGTGNFWMNDFSQGLSFVVGAVLTEGLASGFAQSANVARAKNLFSNISRATGASKAKSFLFPKTSVPKGNAAFNTLLDKRRWGAAGTTLRQLGTGAMYEAGVEARHHKDQTVKNLIQIYKDQNDGKMPDKKAMAKIEALAIRSSNSVFAGNVALVGYGNYLMFPKIFGKGFNGTRKTLRGTIKESVKATKNRIPLVGKDYQALYKSISKKRAFTNNLWRILRVPMYEGFVEEGGQRLLDLSGQGAAEYWYNMKKDPEYLDMTGELINHTFSKFDDAYFSAEGSKEIGIGFLLGLLGIPGYTTVKTKEGKTKKEWMIGGFAQTFRDMKKEKAMVDALESSLKENPHAIDALKNATDRLVRAGVIQDMSDFGQIVDSPYLFKNAEFDNVFTYVVSRLQAGLEESIINDINDISNMSLSEFRETFKYNELNDLTDTELKEKQTQLVEMMTDRVNTIGETYSKVNGSFLNFSEDQKLAITHALAVSENAQEREDAIYEKIKEILGVDELVAEEQIESREVRERRSQEQTRSRLKNLWRRMTSKQREAILALPEAKYMMQQKDISEFTGEDIQQLLYGLIQERKSIEDRIQEIYENPGVKPRKTKETEDGKQKGGNPEQNKLAAELEELEASQEKLKKKTEELWDAIKQGLDPELSEAENKLIQEWAERDPKSHSLNREDVIQMFKDGKKLRARRHRMLAMYNELLDYREDVTQSWKWLGGFSTKAKKGKRKIPPKMLGMEILNENGIVAQNAEELTDKHLQRLFTRYQGRVVEFEYVMNDPTTEKGLLGLAKNAGIAEIIQNDVEKILKRRPDLDKLAAIRTALQLRGVDVAASGNSTTYRFYVQPGKAVTGQEDLLIAYPKKETLQLLIRKKALEKLGENEIAKEELKKINKELDSHEHQVSYQTKELNFLKGGSDIRVIDQSKQMAEVLDTSIDAARSEVNIEIEALDNKINEVIEEIGKVSQELISYTAGAAAITKQGEKALAAKVYNISRQEASLKQELDGLEIKKQEAIEKLEVLNKLILEVKKANNPEEVQQKINEFLEENWKDTRQILEEHLNKGFFSSAAYSYPDMNMFSPVFENETDKQRQMELTAMVIEFATSQSELPEELVGLLDKGFADIKHKLDLLLPIINQTRKLLHFKGPRKNEDLENLDPITGFDIYNQEYDLRFKRNNEQERRAKYEALLNEYYKLRKEYDNATNQLREKIQLKLSPVFEEINRQTELGGRLRLVTNIFVENFNNINELIKELTTPDPLPVDNLDSHPGVSENEFDSSKSQMDDISFDQALDANNVSESKPKVYYNSPALIHIGMGKTAGNHYQARQEFNRLEEESTKRKLTKDEENQLEAYRAQLVFFDWSARSDKHNSTYKFKNYRLRPTTRFTLEEEYANEVYFYDHTKSVEAKPVYSTIGDNIFRNKPKRGEDKEDILLMVVDHEGVPVRHEGNLVYTSMMGSNPWVIKTSL
jgi:DNA-binding ferritin-like protein (Dps family)